MHQVKRNTGRKYKVQVGRGGKRGKTSGRGTKGQKARSGRKLRPEIRDIISKLPKLRGYSFRSIVDKPEVFNLKLIDKHFASGDEISPKTLIDKGLLKPKAGKIPTVKILADGEVNKKFKISGCVMSVKAKEKLEKAGGKVE